MLPFPVNLQRAVVTRELRSVVRYNADEAERWLSSVVRRHRNKLRKFGVAEAKIEADVASLVEAFGLSTDKPAIHFGIADDGADLIA